MNKLAKSLILILLILALVFTVVACKDDATTQNGNQSSSGGESGAVITTDPIDKTAVFSRITNGLSLAESVVDKQQIRHVESEYTIIVNKANTTITYEADYDLNRKQDSEIMLKLFDNQYECNKLFVYYYKSTLYYEYNGSKKKIEGFGGSSSFEVFFDIMKSFDLESLFFTEDFAEDFSSLSLFAESTKMHVRTINTNEERIEINDVNLDRMKNSVNRFLQQLFGPATIGTKLDAVSTALLGFNLSDIGELEIGLFNASNVEIILRQNAVTDFNITFSGTQSNNVSTYFFDVHYSTQDGSKKIELGRYDDPETNEYKLSREGENYYSGTINVPTLNTEFLVDVYADLNASENAENVFLIDIRNKTDETLKPDDIHYVDNQVAYLYYINETLYVNIDGLIKYYIGNGVDLKSLGFPTVKLSTLDVARQLSTYSNYAMDYFAGGFSITKIWDSIDFDWEDTTLVIDQEDRNLIDPESPMGILLANCSSNGTEFTIKIDRDFIGATIGENDGDIIEWLATQLSLDKETIEELIGEDVFKNVYAMLNIDMSNGNINILVYNGDDELFNIYLAPQDTPDTGIEISAPKNFVEDDYEEFVLPETVTLHLEGTLRMQGKTSVDMSRFLGAFMGDVTGVNTPYQFGINDKFFVSLYAWRENSVNYSNMIIWDNPTYNGTLTASNITSQPFMTLSTSPANTNVYLIESRMVGYKYQIPRDGIAEAFNDLLGEDNIFSSDNIMEIFRTITGNTMLLMNEDEIAFTIAPYTSNGVTVDPIWQYLGVENMIADIKAQVVFETPTNDVYINDYSTPEFDVLQDLAFTSMYEAKWHDEVLVYFNRDSATKTFKLSFQGESAKLVTGKYYYLPQAKLFGSTISYAMVLTDTVNGTKAIDRLAMSKLSIDPSKANAIPSKIEVIYDDGTLGEQLFTIVGFPYTNANINYALMGASAKNYEIIIGEGSINEIRFILPIEILNRVVVPEVAKDGTSTEVDDAYIGNVPIVRIVTIDPYEYSTQKSAELTKASIEGRDVDVNAYSPIGTTLEIYFRSVVGDAINKETVENFDWGFDESLIDYRGGSFYQYAYYNTIKIALRVDVSAKVFSHIQIVGEKAGEYTVDSLVASSYYIPIETDERAEVRVYFKTGKYRIIGKEPEGFENMDSDCDGYYPIALNWTYPKATNISLDSTVNPLNYGRTNIDTTVFGDNIAGLQDVSITVYSPSRRLSTMADNVHAITSFAIDPITGDILEAETVRESVKISKVGMGEVGGEYDSDGAYFLLDPYATGINKRLPSTITMTVEYAGEKIRRSYPVDWIESSIIDTDGNVVNPTAEDNLMIATGWIGETTYNRQLVTVVIHNLSGKYKSMIIIDPNSGEQIPKISGNYVMTINPYLEYTLPTSFSLEFVKDNGEQKLLTYGTNWMIDFGDGEEALPDDYRFPYTGGQYTITTYVEANVSEGILSQKVDLIIAVTKKEIVQGKVFGLSSSMTPEDDSLEYFTVNPYDNESYQIVTKLSSLTKVGLAFKDGTKIASGLPVVWDNLEEALAVLQNDGGTKDYPNGIFTLTGKVHKFSETLEQNVSVSFKVLEKKIYTIAFMKLDDNTINKNIADAEIDVDNKVINIRIKKPYILTTSLTDQASPSEYLNYLFSAIRIAFEDDSYGTYELKDALPEDMDKKAFTYNGAAIESLVSFTVERLSGGSRKENYEFNVYTTRDDLISDNLSESIETFQADGGTPLYSSGYDLSSSLEVEFKYSGKVTYSGLVWYSKSNNMSEDGSQIILPINEVVPNQNIPSELFRTLTGNTVWLYTKLPNGKEINKTFIFYAKNIMQTKYDAEAEDPYYSIRNGTIIINNIYNLYPFSVAKLPKTIVPQTGSNNPSYQIENEIRFGITWVPTAQFAKDSNPSEFDQNKINRYFNYKGFGGAEDEIFAKATITMYGGATQDIYLYVVVAELSEGKIELPSLDVVSEKKANAEGLLAMCNSVEIDPYENNFGGEYVLPKNITVKFGIQTYSFANNSNITYSIRDKNGNYSSITSIPYTHQGHDLPSSLYGNPTDTLYFKVALPDGQILYLDITFKTRVLKAIWMPNLTNNDLSTVADVDNKIAVGEDVVYVNGIYYIDPYDERTFNVPVKAAFQFEKGDPSELAISYWNISGNNAPFDSNYRFVRNGAFYKGGVYQFTSSLSGYGVLAQEFSVTVVILDRSLATRTDTTTPYTNKFDIIDPISTIASDIPSKLDATASFSSLTADVYAVYNQFSVPVLPSIKWDIENDDLVYTGMQDVVFEGKVKYGDIGGEDVSITVNAPRWDFDKIVITATTVGIDGGFIDFNAYTSKSVAEQVSVSFYVNNTAGTRSSTFYPIEHADNDVKLRTIIDWGERGGSDTELKTFTIGNAYKSLKITVENRYFYRYTQVTVSKIDFGFGAGESNYVELVIDPFNPEIPSQVYAYGREPDSQSLDEDELGYLPITWDDAIYDMPLEGSETAKLVSATLTTSNNVNVVFNVNVYYLNRKPVAIKTTSGGYSTTTAISGEYTLSNRAKETDVVTSYFRIDPTSLATFDETTETYVLPSDLIFEFQTTYSVPAMNTAIKKYGARFIYQDIVWSLSTPITLVGTDKVDASGNVIESNPISAMISSGVLTYVKNAGDIDSEIVNCGRKDYSDGIPESYQLKLKVVNREVEYTSVSTMITTTDGKHYQKALSQYFIDPYEEGYLSSFPSTIVVKYTDAQEQTIQVKEWIFDETYLQRADVISGLILKNGGTPESMTVMAEIRVYGTSIAIQFPIKARNIDTLAEDGEGTVPMEGGTIYILKGMDVRSQLPTYMYYRFEYDGEEDITPVPLSFTDNNIFGVSTAKAGVSYTVFGTLGGINKDNIKFTVTVIDPQAYTAVEKEASIEKGSFLYDYIIVARNTSGFYAIGKEAGLLPKRIFIEGTGEYLTVEKVNYTINLNGTNGFDGYATFNCKYIFNRTASVKLCGNETGDGDGANQLAISFTVPIKTYDYTTVDSTLPLIFNYTEITVTLGSTVKASDMPKAKDSYGNLYDLIWDMSALDTKVAGTYTAYGYYLNNSAKNTVIVLKVNVSKQTALDEDINISSEWLSRIYTGKEVKLKDYTTISPFLRKDGTYGQVADYLVTYSMDGGTIWQKTQPVRVGEYLVKITIDDYNIVGSKVFEFEIEKANIPDNSITFHYDQETMLPASNGQISYVYNGNEQKPYIRGILDDENLTYVITYELRGAYNVDIGDYNYSIATPVNAGTYRVTISFPSQRDYNASRSYSITYQIAPKDVVYSIQREMVYNGLERDAIVNGLPENPLAAGVRVYYTYYNPTDMSKPLPGRVKNVGTYLVTVEIDGGVNYPSANTNGVVANNLVMYEFKILPKEVVIFVNELETEYLEEILPLNSAVTVMDAENPEISGLQGADTVALFLNVLNVYCSDVANGVLTYRHMVNDRTADGLGGYRLVASVIPDSKMPSNYIVKADTGYHEGKYYITATNGAKVISNKVELDNAIAQLQDNQEVKWYLRNGDYGTITINKNATVSIVGSYAIETGEIAVNFNGITILNGGVTVDIVNLKAVSKTSSLYIGENATSVTVNRTNFVRSGSAYLTGSMAVSSAPMFKGTLTMSDSNIYGYTVGIYMRGGSLSLSNTNVTNNIIGVQVQSGNMILLNNVFGYNRSEAVYNTSIDGDVSISDNSFIGNSIAVKSYQQLLNDILVQNVFNYNAIDTYQMD